MTGLCRLCESGASVELVERRFVELVVLGVELPAGEDPVAICRGCRLEIRLLRRAAAKRIAARVAGRNGSGRLRLENPTP